MIEKAFSQAEYAINITDARGVLIRVNQAYLRLYRFGSDKDVVGKRQNIIRSPFTPPSVYKEMWETISSGHAWRGELTNRAADGSDIFIHLTIMPIQEEGRIVGYMGYSLDRSQQVLLEQQLLHANKLVVLGTLGAGLAHELNNPLTSILLEAEYLSDSLAEPERPIDYAMARAATQSVLKGVERMKRVIEHLLLYSRKDGPAEPEPIAVQDIVHDSFLFLEKQLVNRGIRIETEIAPGIRVRGDKIQLESVFHNLLTNSRDAFESAEVRGERLVRIEAAPVEGHYISIRYFDNAGGIPAGILPHIWDPFFTTKAEGKGTGLGLSITKKIIAEHGGSIACEPGPGSTAFVIQLPEA